MQHWFLMTNMNKMKTKLWLLEITGFIKLIMYTLLEKNNGFRSLPIFWWKDYIAIFFLDVVP